MVERSKTRKKHVHQNPDTTASKVTISPGQLSLCRVACKNALVPERVSSPRRHPVLSDRDEISREVEKLLQMNTVCEALRVCHIHAIMTSIRKKAPFPV
jgi:hypothetical protein